MEKKKVWKVKRKSWEEKESYRYRTAAVGIPSYSIGASYIIVGAPT